MTNNAATLVTLLDIMDTAGPPIRRRIEACEVILGFEAPPQVIERAKAFLVAVFEDAASHSVEDRLQAAALMRKAEARKISPGTTHAADMDKDKETWRALEIAARRMKLFRAGLWEQHGPDWADDLLAGDYQSPKDRTINSLFDD